MNHNYADGKLYYILLLRSYHLIFILPVRILLEGKEIGKANVLMNQHQTNEIALDTIPFTITELNGFMEC